MREHLIQYNIAPPGHAPQNLMRYNESDIDDLEANLSTSSDSDNVNTDPSDFLDPQLEADNFDALPLPSIHPLPSYLSTMSDEELDAILSELRSHYRRAGLCMLDGMLKRLGHRVQTERIRQSLLRIDPVHRIFDRIRIRRRGYTVPGPNALWHHDGQHGNASAHLKLQND